MKLPKRFALSTLLLLMLFVASIFGFAQWRRQWLKSAVADFNRAHGTDLVMSQSLFWPKATDQPQIPVPPAMKVSVRLTPLHCWSEGEG